MIKRKDYTKPAMQVVEMQLHAELLVVSGLDKQALRQGYDPLDWLDEVEQ